MYINPSITAILCLSVGSSAFLSPGVHRAALIKPVIPMHSSKATTQMFMDQAKQEDQDYEIERLKSMAAKLRAEAAALEAAQAAEIAAVTENTFKKFDTNDDGEISFDELKAGLELSLKTELSDDRVQKLMEEFDKSGDGALQLDEFVGVEKFRNRLEALIREEKSIAVEAAKQAKLEAEAAAVAAARMDLLNDREPTGTERALSLLPYLFPLLDSLQFGRFILESQGPENPVVIVLSILFTLYRSVPFSGFLAFLALNLLSGNLRINKLIRFNMQQAIFLDIALFFPGLLAGIFQLIASGAGFVIPVPVTVIGYDLVFVSLLIAVGYSCVSSLLGTAPDKIPIVSKAVTDRMPTIDMLDDNGRFIGPPRDENNDEDKGEKK